MSRTRKDAPAWVRQNRAAHLNTRIRHGCGASLCHGTLACDAYRADVPAGARVCRRALRGAWWDPYATTASERSSAYWEPERQNTRQAVRRAVRAARRRDFDDIDVPTAQHRHGTFGGGWWD
jgi:hypothetical protein